MSSKSTTFFIITILLLACFVGVAHASSSELAFVANQGSGTVSVIDTSTYSVIRSVASGGSQPDGALLNPSGTNCYIYNTGSGTVSVLDTAEFNIKATISGLGQPYKGIIDKTGRFMYVTNGPVTAPHTLYKIDLLTNTIVYNVSLGSYTALGVTLNVANDEVWVVGSHLVIIDANGGSVKNDISLGTGVWGNYIAASPDGLTMAISTPPNNQIVFYSTSSKSVVGTRQLDTGSSPRGVAWSPDGTYVYVVASGTGKMHKIAYPALTYSMNVSSLGGTPWQIALNTAGSVAFITVKDDDVVKSVDTVSGTTIATISVGDSPFDVSVGQIAAESVQNYPQLYTLIAYDGSLTNTVQGLQTSTYNSNNQLIGSNVTDSSGAVSFFLVPGNTYTINYSSGTSYTNYLTYTEATLESGTTGWSNTVGTISQSSTYAWQGAYSLKITDTGSYGNAFVTGFSVTPGTDYSFSCYGTASSANTYKTVTCVVEWFYANGTHLAYSSGVATNVSVDGVWSRVSLSATAPSGAAISNLYVNCGGAHNGDVFYVDGLAYEASGSVDTWGWPNCYASNYISGSIQFQPESSILVYYFDVGTGRLASQNQLVLNGQTTIQISFRNWWLSPLTGGVAVYSGGQLVSNGTTDDNGFYTYPGYTNIQYQVKIWSSNGENDFEISGTNYYTLNIYSGFGSGIFSTGANLNNMITANATSSYDDGTGAATFNIEYNNTVPGDTNSVFFAVWEIDPNTGQWYPIASDYAYTDNAATSLLVPNAAGQSYLVNVSCNSYSQGQVTVGSWTFSVSGPMIQIPLIPASQPEVYYVISLIIVVLSFGLCVGAGGDAALALLLGCFELFVLSAYCGWVPTVVFGDRTATNVAIGIFTAIAVLGVFKYKMNDWRG